MKYIAYMLYIHTVGCKVKCSVALQHIDLYLPVLLLADIGTVAIINLAIKLQNLFAGDQKKQHSIDKFQGNIT